MDFRTAKRIHNSPQRRFRNDFGNGDANHSPPLENLPREVQLAGGTIFSNAKGINLIFVQGNEIPTPEQNITSVR